MDFFLSCLTMWLISNFLWIFLGMHMIVRGREVGRRWVTEMHSCLALWAVHENYELTHIHIYIGTILLAGGGGYSLVMKLTNSDTHSCMHSFASFETCIRPRYGRLLWMNYRCSYSPFHSSEWRFSLFLTHLQWAKIGPVPPIQTQVHPAITCIQSSSQAWSQSYAVSPVPYKQCVFVFGGWCFGHFFNWILESEALWVSTNISCSYCTQIYRDMQN